jgi:hypothetical protein
MKKKLLSTLLLITIVGVMNSLAQAVCTPDISCVPVDSTFGICPDSATGLPLGTVGQAYTVTMSVKIPATVTLSGTTYNLTHLALTEILVDTAGTGNYDASLSDLGLNYLGNGTNTPSGGVAGPSGYTMTNYCYWNAPGSSCVIVNGIPNKEGTFPIKIKSKGRAVVFFVGVWGDGPENNDYRLVISSTTGIELLSSTKFDVKQNSPNPFSFNSTIEYAVPTTGKVSVDVRNILGELIYTENTTAQKGINTLLLDATKFTNGMYFYQINYNNTSITKRFIVNK